MDQLQHVVTNDDFLDVSRNDDTSSAVIICAFLHRIFINSDAIVSGLLQLHLARIKLVD